MAKIRIGDTIYEAKLTHAGRTLGLCFTGMRLDEVAALLSEERAPEIRELGADGATKAIYRNHALTRVYAETVGGEQRVSAALLTEIIEQKEAEALREQLEAANAKIAALGEENAMLTECVLEMSQTVYA